MNEIHIAVVEDEASYCEEIKGYLERFRLDNGLVLSVRFYNDGKEILDQYQVGHDIILMDIQMQFMDGMTAARKIRERDPDVVLIFLTSMAGYAIQGYEVDALDYILKPVSYDMFAMKLKRALQRIRYNEPYVILQVHDGSLKVNVSDIYYIESRSHQMIYKTKKGEYSCRGRMDDLEKEMKSLGFFRCNRGYLVNLANVSAVRGESCFVGGEELPVSRQKKAAFMNELAKVL